MKQVRLTPTMDGSFWFLKLNPKRYPKRKHTHIGVPLNCGKQIKPPPLPQVFTWPNSWAFTNGSTPIFLPLSEERFDGFSNLLRARCAQKPPFTRVILSPLHWTQRSARCLWMAPLFSLRLLCERINPSFLLASREDLGRSPRLLW